MVPVDLTHGAEVIRDIPEDEVVTHENVRLVDSGFLEFKTKQDELKG